MTIENSKFINLNRYILLAGIDLACQKYQLNSVNI